MPDVERRPGCAIEPVRASRSTVSAIAGSGPSTNVPDPVGRGEVHASSRARRGASHDGRQAFRRHRRRRSASPQRRRRRGCPSCTVSQWMRQGRQEVAPSPVRARPARRCQCRQVRRACRTVPLARCRSKISAPHDDAVQRRVRPRSPAPTRRLGSPSHDGPDGPRACLANGSAAGSPPKRTEASSPPERSPRRPCRGRTSCHLRALRRMLTPRALMPPYSMLRTPMGFDQRGRRRSR